MFDCILLMAGNGSRCGLGYNKIKHEINNKPLYQYSLEKFLEIPECNNIIIVSSNEDYNDFIQLQSEKIKVVVGGDTRSKSVLNGIKHSNAKTVIIHDAARPNVQIKDILNVYEFSKNNDSVSLGVKVKDCIRCVNDDSYTLERSDLWQVQTPQALNKELLLKGLENKRKPGNPLAKFSNKKELTELEKLQYENLLLRIENERLKKGYTSEEADLAKQKK